MQLRIRRMGVEDMAAVQQVARITWAATYAGIIPTEVQERFIERAYAPAALQRRMEQGVFLVALQGEQVVGFINLFRRQDGAVELAAVYVRPEAQGQGIGSQLLQAGLAAFPRPCDVRVSVERDNRQGRAFYAARGFAVLQERVERVLGHDFQLVDMGRTLEPATS